MGEAEVKYSDVVSRCKGFTMIVRLSGGRNAQIEPHFLVFKNNYWNYLICGVLRDSVLSVVYRTRSKGWVDTVVASFWLSETRFISALRNGFCRHLWVDNCSGHNRTASLSKAPSVIRTVIHYFPHNSVHLLQPFESFIIQKIQRGGQPIG